MALDPNIILAGAAQPTVQMQTPLDTFMKGLSLRAMVNQDQSRQLQMQMQQQQLKQAQQSYQDQQNLRSLFASNANPNAQQIYAAGGPMAGMQIVKGMTEAQQAAANLQKTKGDIATQENDFLGKVAGAVRANNYSPDSIKQAFQLATNAGYGQHVQQIAAQIQANPASAKQIFDGLYQSAMSAKDQAATQAQMIAANARADQAKESARHNGVTEQQAATNAAEVARNNAFNNQAKIQDLKIAQQNTGLNAARVGIEKQRLANEDPNIVLTPQAQQALSDAYAAGAPVLQGLGMGRNSAMLKGSIINNAVASHPGLDIGSNQASFAANKQSLESLQKSKDAIESFENTALSNLKMVQDAAKDIPDSGFTPVNEMLRGFASKTGNPAVTKFQTALKTAQSEIGKVLSGGGMSGVLSDSARHEMDQALSPNATRAQIQQAVQTLQQEMSNRKAALDQQVQTIHQRMGGKAPAPTVTHRFNPATGQIEAIQ